MLARSLDLAAMRTTLGLRLLTYLRAIDLTEEYHGGQPGGTRARPAWRLSLGASMEGDATYFIRRASENGLRRCKLLTRLPVALSSNSPTGMMIWRAPSRPVINTLACT